MNGPDVVQYVDWCIYCNDPLQINFLCYYLYLRNNLESEAHHIG